MVDEIEMHLHPEWQQVILSELMTAFPLVQLIVTTHSPQIVTTVKGKSIRILNNGGVFAPSSSPYGHEAGMALPSVFNVPQRPPNDEVTSELGRYFELIRSDSYSEKAAEEIIDRLTTMGYELSSDEERRAALLLKHFNNSRIVGS